MRKRDSPVYRMDFTFFPRYIDDEIDEEEKEYYEYLVSNSEELQDRIKAIEENGNVPCDEIIKQLKEFDDKIEELNLAMCEEEVVGLKATLGQLCTNYCFQLEKCPNTNRLHFQGRVIWIKKIRVSTLANNNIRKGVHWSQTSNNNGEDFSYVMKGETRIKGPWYDKSFGHDVPLQIRNIKELRPWQQKLLCLLLTWDERTVHLIYDEVGASGKSTFAGFCQVFYDFGLCPPFNNSQNLIQSVCSMGAKKAYLFDLPRAMGKDNLAQTFAAIEQVKSGFVMDTRYRYRMLRMTNPGVCVFSNAYPDLKLLSADRWKIWKIINDDLVPCKGQPGVMMSSTTVEDTFKPSVLTPL